MTSTRRESAAVHFAQLLRERAAADPGARAYAICRRGRWRSFSTGDLEAASDGVAYQLADAGVRNGDRTLILIPPGFELFATVFAVMKLGAAPVLLDPAAGLDSFQRCLEDSAPEVMVSSTLGHLFRCAHPSVFRSVQRTLSLGRFGGRRINVKPVPSRGAFPIAWPPEHAPAAILFTSGSTGTPKGCRYSHAQFVALVGALREGLQHAPGSADLSTFPILGLFAPILGGTSVLPAMNFARPSRADPAELLRAIDAFGCASMFGSSELVERLCAHALSVGRVLPLECVMTAGAPPSPRLLRCVRGVAGDTGPRLLIPYGSTECLLVSVADSTSLPPPGPLGVCVGRPVAGHQVRIIPITDEPVLRWDQALALPPGVVGEITVKGPLVSSAYEGPRELTERAKILDGDSVVHRMGDLGALDDQGRLWLAGRKTHRVSIPEGDVFPLVVESVVNLEPGVRRSALVNVLGEPWLMLELEARTDPAEVAARVTKRLAETPFTRPVREVRIAKGPFPVDARHEVKIDRSALSAEQSDMETQRRRRAA